MNLPSVERDLARYLAAINRFPMLSADEEAMYACRWRTDGDRTAAYHLVTSHLRLAAKIALKYRGYGLPVADLISEANVGLMLAVKRFEPEKGFRLATYAVWWMRAAVQEYVLRSWSMVKLGTTAAQKTLFFNLRRLKNRIAKHDGDLSGEQISWIAESLKVRSSDVLAMNERLRGDVSLSAPAGDRDDNQSLQDRLADPLADPEAQLCETEERVLRATALQQAMAGLTARERRIIVNRFLSEQPQTLHELGRELGVSAERIRQIETRALQRLKALIVQPGLDARGRASAERSVEITRPSTESPRCRPRMTFEIGHFGAPSPKRETTSGVPQLSRLNKAKVDGQLVVTWAVPRAHRGRYPLCPRHRSFEIFLIKSGRYASAAELARKQRRNAGKRSRAQQRPNHETRGC
jgi:RNA polymerase sigma-32 factor